MAMIYDNLFDKITSFDNLLLAHRKARKGKRKSKSVADFELKLEENLFLLQEELQNRTYSPSSYQTFFIYDPKKRMISASSYRDRVVHHALCNLLIPNLEKLFIFDSYANREGKGTHKAIDRCQKFMRRHPNGYYLKCDIKKYFASINHQKLKEIIRKKVICKPTLWLIDTIIDNSNPQEKTDFMPSLWQTQKKGLPIGNLTSQYFANWYLNDLDYFIKNNLKVKSYLRYVDDFVLFDEDKDKLGEHKKKIEHFLKSYFLFLHPNKSLVKPVRKGITFLGQQLFLNHRKIKSENLRRFWKRTQNQQQLYFQNKISLLTLETSLNSWKGHAKQADTKGLLAYVFKQFEQKGLPLKKTLSGSWRFLEQQ
jgi:retron-type reverse transcriptase